jgi:trimeric autotransporter adhesin
VASTADSSDTAATTALASSLTCCGTPIERLCSFLIDGERAAAAAIATASTATTAVAVAAYDWPAARLLALNTLQALTASSGAAGAGALVRTAALPLLVSYLQPPLATAAGTIPAATAAAAATAATATATTAAADAALAEAALKVLAVLAAAAQTAVDKPLVTRRRSSASASTAGSSSGTGDSAQPLTAAVLVAALDAVDCWSAVCNALEGQFLRAVGGLVPGAAAAPTAAAGSKVSFNVVLVLLM